MIIININVFLEQGSPIREYNVSFWKYAKIEYKRQRSVQICIAVEANDV
jgi:hypothetical protein